MGALSPWQSVESFGLSNASPLVPKGCSIVQVHLVHRHGARYPTSDALPAVFAAKLHAAATGKGFSASGPFEFLNTWTYKLGAETLTPFGRSQLFNLGMGFRMKYGELLKGFSNLPVFRTTSEARMQDSALHFAAGFFGVQTYQMEYHQLITIEGEGFNNTLAPYFHCPNSNNPIGSVQASKWEEVYLQSAWKRLAPFIRGYHLTLKDLVAMQQLCAYETVALSSSLFCALFTEQEWKGYEYRDDIMLWYGNGPGSPSASAQGIGYVQEVLSRLKKIRITEFRNTVNSTVVTNNVTFPLDQPIYVDATHDTALTTIFTAFNFTSLAAGGPLQTDQIPRNQTYFANRVVPFASNLVGQVLSCPAFDKPEQIRWILNDAVLPLTGIRGCEKNDDGLCGLSTFIAAMEQRIGEVDFDFDCFANYTIPDPDEITDGQFPRRLRN
ncbi:histidine phosphatase superfamily [Collybia nuda]|uniref:Histidine phosphatase superfamily n=1 Tax=Collybia nuda TaxID=64659 RepID=A0A9P5Y6E0_9AGAR|nr:histidine phosphatase superfamily [Collybia nuda]